MGKLTVTVPEELHERIRKALENKGMTTAQFIQQAVYMCIWMTTTRKEKGTWPHEPLHFR